MEEDYVLETLSAWREIGREEPPVLPSRDVDSADDAARIAEKLASFLRSLDK